MHRETLSREESITLAYSEISIKDEQIDLRLSACGRQARLERNQTLPDGTVLSMIYLIGDAQGLSEFCAADPFWRHVRDAYSQIQEKYERFAEA